MKSFCACAIPKRNNVIHAERLPRRPTRGRPSGSCCDLISETLASIFISYFESTLPSLFAGPANILTNFRNIRFQILLSFHVKSGYISQTMSYDFLSESEG